MSTEPRPNRNLVEKKVNGEHIDGELFDRAIDGRRRGAKSNARNRPAKLNGKHASEARPRAAREPPARSGPNRSMSNAFRSAKAGRASDGAEAARRAVEGAVDTAYRICEDYLNWGRTAASSRDRNDGTAGDGRTTMRRHPYAMHGMGNPMMKWWYDMACFYMGWAMPHGWDGGHYPSDHGRCSDGDSCGYRGCHAHHGDSRARETPSLSKQLCITLKHDAPVEARIELGKLCRKVSKTIRLLKHESHATIQVPVTLDPEDTSKVTIDVPKGAEPGRYEGVLSDDGNVVAVIFLDIKTAG